MLSSSSRSVYCHFLLLLVPVTAIKSIQNSQNSTRRQTNKQISLRFPLNLFPLIPSPPIMPRKPTLKFHSLPHCNRTKLMLTSMAATAFLTLISLLLFFSLSSSARQHHVNPRTPSVNPNQQFTQACKATRFPQTCESTLSSRLPNSSNPPKPLEIVQSAVSASAENVKTAQSMVKSILDSSSSNPNRSMAAKNCLEVLHNSEYRLSSTAADALPSGRTKDARAWLSAALCFQYDCWSALKYVNDSQSVSQAMAFMNSLTELTSNALSLTRSYDLYHDEIASWTPPATERDGFWESSSSVAVGGSESGLNVGFPADLTADATVCKGAGGSECFPTVQAAVDAAPENLGGGKKYVIRIREGVYEETVRVPLEKRNLVFLGDGMGKTVITGSAKVGPPGVTTYSSATVGVAGDGFMARDLTIENKAGPDAHQAVAFRSDSDLSIIENCEFLGNQDTLYAHALRQFYRSCHIYGNVDFIFGNSAAVFQDCLVFLRPRQIAPEKGENNAVTAHGRTDPGQSTGFVFRNCTINGTAEYMALYRSKPKVHRNYLGRPWKEFSRTVFLNCYLEELISPPGWMPWSGDFALQTLYYGEFESSGPGGNGSGRVPWSSQVPKEHVQAYSVDNFIQGNEWIRAGSSN